jgi:hypothetical protein
MIWGLAALGLFAVAVLVVEPWQSCRTSKSVEAREKTKQLYDAARAYYMDLGAAKGSVPAQFPTVGVGPTPPIGLCCQQGGKCQPDASLWTHPTWKALGFSIDEPHYYSYSYETKDSLGEFTVRANGDLDCDDDLSTFEMLGIINADAKRQ